jgi:lysozyme
MKKHYIFQKFIIFCVIAVAVFNKTKEHNTYYSDQPSQQIRTISQPVKTVVKKQQIDLTMYKRLIVLHEGYSKTPYKCSGGYVTVGYGHRVVNNKMLKMSHKELLYNDILKAKKAVDASLTVKVSQLQHVALVSLTYNIGENAFKNSRLVQCINSGNSVCVKQQFNKWIYAAGKRNKGLEKRRHAEYMLYELGA